MAEQEIYRGQGVHETSSYEERKVDTRDGSNRNKEPRSGLDDHPFTVPVGKVFLRCELLQNDGTSPYPDRIVSIQKAPPEGATGKQLITVAWHTTPVNYYLVVYAVDRFVREVPDSRNRVVEAPTGGQRVRGPR